MSIEFLKDIKYLNTTFEVIHKLTNKRIFVYVSIDNNDLKIYDDNFIDNTGLVEIIDCENYNIFNKADLEILDEVTCDLCEKNEATIINTGHIYCADCNSLEKIDNMIYKFRSKEDLHKLLFAFDYDQRFLPCFENYDKGILIANRDMDYDVYHIKIIEAHKIGDFE